MIDQGKRIREAASKIIMATDIGRMFFSARTARTQLESADVRTLMTNGVVIRYSDEFCSKQDDDFLGALVLHEVLHGALRHIERGKNKDGEIWAIAAELACNSVLSSIYAGIGQTAVCRMISEKAHLPGSKPYEDMPFGMSAEWYYLILKNRQDQEEEQEQDQEQEQEQEQEDDSAGGDSEAPKVGADPAGMGGFEESKDPLVQQENEMLDDETTSGAQALLSRSDSGPLGQWLLPHFMKYYGTPWEERLAEYLVAQGRNGYSWRRLSRRSPATKILMPGIYSDEIGQVSVMIDTSGSINQAQVERFLSELEPILTAYEVCATIYWHHRQVYRVQEWEPSDGVIPIGPIESGGTSHKECFDRVSKADKYPNVIIGFTDLESDLEQLPKELYPDCPVLWVWEDGEPWADKAPFGERYLYPRSQAG